LKCNDSPSCSAAPKAKEEKSASEDSKIPDDGKKGGTDTITTTNDVVDCEAARCACFGGVFNNSRWNMRPDPQNFRSEVYCDNVRDSNCLVASKCQKDFELCTQNALVKLVGTVPACTGAAVSACVTEMTATADSVTQACIANACADAVRMGVAQPNMNSAYGVRGCMDLWSEKACNSPIEGPGCRWNPTNRICEGQLQGNIIPSFEQRIEQVCKGKSIEETCVGSVSSFDKAKCTCGTDATVCAKTFTTLSQQCESKEVEAAWSAAATSDASAKVEYDNCVSQAETCAKGLIGKTGACGGIRGCWDEVNKCVSAIFVKRTTNEKFSAPALKGCLASMGNGEQGWGAQCTAAVCSGNVPHFVKLSENTETAIRQLVATCSVDSLCNVAAPPPVLVTTTFTVTMTTHINVEFVYYKNATAEQQKAFQDSFIKDLYTALNLDPKVATIRITSVTAGSIAIDYEVVTVVVTEQGAPPPTAPPMPTAGTNIQITNTKASLQQNLGVPADIVNLASATQTTDPKISTKVTVGDQPATNTTCVYANGTLCSDMGAVQNNFVLPTLLGMLMMVLLL